MLGRRHHPPEKYLSAQHEISLPKSKEETVWQR